ncbi:hypothetical protein PHSY_001826 [Pseudozyma hubeiensis SY62]|uniref:Uncharacterized protein n=1 Tax=Pseudozyma hubeiensis (strain SY62) TaxID=1305764 RepID=R9P845_PSEHS|nr:hypothetical protein PHSY_001826 [Pseudozyma hubeiensis SY62]GAC94255.1 hypothetical protein PHSY_001826 [Pseudozyma hubeiensis SY62]
MYRAPLPKHGLVHLPRIPQHDERDPPTRGIADLLQAPQLCRQHHKPTTPSCFVRIYTFTLLHQLRKLATHEIAIGVEAMHLVILASPPLPQPILERRSLFFAAFRWFDVLSQWWCVDLCTRDVCDGIGVARSIACNGRSDACHGEVDVDRRWRYALHEDAPQRVEILTVSRRRNARIPNGEVDQPQIIHLLGQRSQTEEQSRRSRQQAILQILDPHLLCEFCRNRSRLIRHQCAFGKDEEEKFLGGSVGRRRLGGSFDVVLGRDFLQLFCQLSLIAGPITSQKDEPVELHTPPNEGDPLERFLEDDQNAIPQIRIVRQTPQIQPIRIHLVVRHPNRPTRHIHPHNPPALLVPPNERLRIEISTFTISDGDDELGRSEELRDDEQDACEGELGVGDVRVVDGFGGGVKAEGPGEELKEMCGDDAAVEDECEEDGLHKKMTASADTSRHSDG